MDEGTDLPVEYDMSFSTNSRINYLLWLCNESMTKEDPLEWSKALKNLLKECYTHMKEDEWKTHQDRMKKADELVKKYIDYARNYEARGGKTPFNPPRESFDNLYDWELIIRKKLDKMGLLMKRGDDLSNALL